MAHKPRSVGERMRSTKSLEFRRGIAVEWYDRWRSQHELLITAMEEAASIENIGLVRKNLGQLKEMSRKNFDALPGIIRRLSDPEAETED